MLQPPSSPLHPVAPPSKKQRSGNDALSQGDDEALGTGPDDAIARRRAELRRLQQMRSSHTPGGTRLGTTADDLMTQARNQLGSARKPPSTGASPPNSAYKPPAPVPPLAPGIPPPRPVSTSRHSDFLPSTTKVVPSSILSKPSATPAIREAVQAPPTTTTKKEKSTRKVARKLDTTFSKSPPPSTETDVLRSKSAPPMRPPVPTPPVPPRLVMEAPPTSGMRRTGTPARPPHITPFMNDTHSSATEIIPVDTTETPPSTVRRDFLRSMREFADSPGAEKGSNQLRMMQELKKAQQDKEDAYRKVARLQEQVQQLQKQDHSKKDLEVLVELADQRGNAAALQWAKSQISETLGRRTTSSSVGFLSPMISHVRTTSPGQVGMSSALSPLAGHAVRKRVATPHPKRKTGEEANREREYLIEATKSTPDEFFSSLATYEVRRPYTTSANPNLWSVAAVVSSNEYQMNAEVAKPFTLEVAATITADGSILTLSGVSTVRHKKTESNEWKVYEDVDDMDRPLGCVMFLDSEYNEKEYWLDEIYEEALATRATYSSSLLATASALQANVMQRVPQSPTNGVARESVKLTEVEVIREVEVIKQVEVIKEIERARPQMSDASVDTSDLQMVEGLTLTSEDTGMPVQTQQPSKQASVPPESKQAPALLEEDGASDVLSVMLGMLFSAIFSLLYFILVRVPIRIVSFTFLATITGVFVSMAWLYFADDHGAKDMGAGMSYGFNRYGIV